MCRVLTIRTCEALVPMHDLTSDLISGGVTSPECGRTEASYGAKNCDVSLANTLE